MMPDGHNHISMRFESCDYIPGFFKELSPSLLEFCLLNNGMIGPDTQQPFTYCELGYGQGRTLNLLAAANPHGTFYGTDFNRSHFESATAVAETGGLSNLHLFADSFEAFGERDLPQFDIIVLHGIFSWVDDACRQLLLQFVKQHLKPCGLVYVSYNALPGWSDLMPLRRLLLDCARTTRDPRNTTEEHAAQTLALATRIATQSNFLQDRPTTVKELERLNQLPLGYLAHEYLVPDMQAFYAGDVIDLFGANGLDYSGSAGCLSNAVHTMTSSGGLDIITHGSPPARRETFQDFLRGSRFRQDLYSRGGTSLSEEEAVVRFMDISLFPRMTPTDAAARFANDPQTKILQTIHSHVWASTFSGDNTVRALIGQLGVQPDYLVTFLSLLQTAIGYGALYPCRSPGGTSYQQASMFNEAILTHHLHFGDTIDHLASPVLGSAVHISLEGLAALRSNTRKARVSEAEQETLTLLRTLGCLS